MDMKQVAELARDIIFGQMRVVLATMPIEEINADRDKLIENIYAGVEVELKKVGLRLINVNIQDITDESGYIDALGKEAAAHAINEAKVRVAEKERDGAIGAAEAERDRRIRVADAGATATEGENLAGVKVAQSNAKRREQEAEAERMAIAAEKVKTAQALTEAYRAEEESERQRGAREEATQVANVVVPAEVKKREIEVLAEAEAERVRRTRKGEADGLRSMMEAEAAGLEAVLSRKAQGFSKIVEAAQGLPELASLLLVVEQLPKLVEEQVKAISNLKIDQITVWDGGKNGDGKTATADFLSGLIGALPPLHELTRNVGVKLPEYLGRMERASAAPPEVTGGGGGDLGPGGGGRLSASGGEGTGRGRATAAGREAGGKPGAKSGAKHGSGAKSADGDGEDDGAGGRVADAAEGARQTAPPKPVPSAAAPAAQPEPEPKAAPGGLTPKWLPRSLQEATADAAEAGRERLRAELRGLLAAQPGFLRQLDADDDGRVDRQEIDAAIDAALSWAARTRDSGAAWYYAEGGQTAGPAPWRRVREAARKQPALPINLDGAPLWLPFEVVVAAEAAVRR
jgi:flotillin